VAGRARSGSRSVARSVARSAALVVGLPLLAAAPLLAATAYGAEGEPTITFSSSGTPPLVCGTRPSVSRLTVRTGTKIITANLTGVPATVDIGRRKVLDLAPGMGALVKLKKGQHELRMIPGCAVLTETDPAVVNVLADGQPPDEPPVPPVDNPDDPVDDPITVALATTSPIGTAGPTAGGSGVADPGAGGPAEAGPGGGPAGPSTPSGAASGVAGSSGSARSARSARSAGSSGSAGATGVVDGAAVGVDGSLASEVIDVQEVSLGGSRDPKGVRLLGVIAAICVFGVTVAIIRAIVSQRTSTTVTM
jgi:hypothetical protein